MRVELGRGGVLHEHHAPGAANRAQAHRAVRTGAGKDDADGPLALILGQVLEQEIDRQAHAALLDGRAQVQHAFLDRKIGVGGDRVNGVDLDRRAVLGRDHVHLGHLVQDLGHQALMGRVKVLDDQERHAAVGRHRGKEFLERFQAAGRSPDADNRKKLRRPTLESGSEAACGSESVDCCSICASFRGGGTYLVVIYLSYLFSPFKADMTVPFSMIRGEHFSRTSPSQIGRGG